MDETTFKKNMEIIFEACKNYGKLRPDGTMQGYEAKLTPDEIREIITKHDKETTE